jgi:hypothetical protein
MLLFGVIAAATVSQSVHSSYPFTNSPRHYTETPSPHPPILLPGCRGDCDRNFIGSFANGHSLYAQGMDVTPLRSFD